MEICAKIRDPASIDQNSPFIQLVLRIFRCLELRTKSEILQYDVTLAPLKKLFGERHSRTDGIELW